MNTARQRSIRSTTGAVALIAVVVGSHAVQSQALAESSSSHSIDDTDRNALERAQRAFYNGEYEHAAAASQGLCDRHADNFAPCELRSASLLFRIKKALKEAAGLDRTTAWRTVLHLSGAPVRIPDRDRPESGFRAGQAERLPR